MQPLPGRGRNPVMHPRLRAVGRLLLFALLAFVLFPAAGGVLQKALGHADATVVYILGHLAQLVALLIFCAIAAGMERRPFAAYGMPWREALRSRFWQGVCVGLVSLAILMLALRLTGAVQI